MVCWDTSHTPPHLGCLPLNFIPHTQSLVPCALLFSGISVSYLGLFFPSVEGFGGVPPSFGEAWGAHQLFSCPYAHSGTFFVVHYGSHLLRLRLLLGYSGIFWPVFHVISDSGSFPDRVSSMPWHGSTPPLMLRGSGGVLGSHFGATAANFIFNASSSLCQLYYGFSTGRFLFQSWASHHIVSYICLVSVLVSAFYFQVLSWMLYSPMGAQPLGFAPWQPFGVYPWQAYVQPGDGQWPTPDMHRVAAPSVTLGRGEPSATHSAVPQPIGGVYSLGGSIESHLIPLPFHVMGRGLLFQVWCHQMMQLILILFWALNLVILVWWLGIIRLMSLLTPGLQSSLWPAPTFILGSLARCHH